MTVCRDNRWGERSVVACENILLWVKKRVRETIN